MKYLKTFQLYESTERLNQILDKISKSGMDSLSDLEKKFLDQKSKDEVVDDTEDLLSIEKGYVFEGNILGNKISFEFDEVEGEGGEIYGDDGEEHDMYRIDGKVEFGEYDYLGFIYIRVDNDEYQYCQLYCLTRNDYIEFDENIEKELNRFFSDITEKVSKI